MQRIATLLAVCAPASVAAQAIAATQLWRLAGTTLPVAQALATGGGSAVWNPAQLPPMGRASICVEIIQTPAAVSATGVLTVGRLRVRPLGEFGLLYGNMEMADLVRTTLSPAQDSGAIPYYAQFVAGNWTVTHRGTTLGATLGLQDVRVDQTQAQRAAFDIGVTQVLPWGTRVAAVGHLFAPLAAGDASHDFYGGVEHRVWRGTLWRGSGPVSLLARYGVAFGHGVNADHHVGLGLQVAEQFLADVQLAREGGYGAAEWRGSAGVGIRIGRYRLSYARDAGISDIGSAYRIGLEAQTK
jgi:hypothetical protein